MFENITAESIANWGKPKKRIIAQGVAMTTRKPTRNATHEKESDIQKAIIQYLKLKGIFCYKQSTTGIYKVSTGSYIPNASAGAPDIVAIRPQDGRYIGIEVKTRIGRVSPKQEAFGRKIQEAGGLYIVARSVQDVQDVIEKLYKIWKQ